MWFFRCKILKTKKCYSSTCIRQAGGQRIARKKGDPRGFVVRDAPWSGGGGKGHAPDTASTEDFPEFGATVGKPSAPIAWGPRRK